MAGLTMGSRTSAFLVLLLAFGLFSWGADAQSFPLDPEDEVIFSFDCKMNVVWRPATKKYAFFAPDVAVQSDCTFEDFMWHHVLVAFDEEGSGKLYVDGEVQHLESLGGSPLGQNFTTCMYPRLNVTTPLETPGSCSAVDESAYAASCPFIIGKSCAADSVMGQELLGFDGLVDEVVVYNRDVSAGDAEVEDIMFKMPMYIQPREVAVPTGVQKDLSLGRVLYAKFNKVPCTLPDAAVSNTTDAHDNSGLTAYVKNDATGQYSFDLYDDAVTISNLGRSVIVYTGVPFKPPQVQRVSSGGVEGTLPLGGKGAAKLIVSGAGFAKSPFSKCALIQPRPNEVQETKAWEPLYGPGPTPSVYNQYFLTSADPTADRNGLTVYSYTGDGYLSLKKHRDTVSLSAASAVEYEGVEGTKGGRTAPYYHEFGIKKNPYRPAVGVLGPRLSWSMYEQVECDMPAAAFPSDRYDLVVSNDGGITGASSGYVEVSEMSMVFDGETELTFARPWNAWTPYAVSFWMRADIATQNNAVLLDLNPGSDTLALLSFSLTSASSGYISYANGDRASTFSEAGATLTNRGNGIGPTLPVWHHVMVLMETRITGTQVTVYVDGQAIYGPEVSRVAQPVPATMGTDFRGVIDEYKLFKEPPAPAGVLDRAFVREPDSAPLLLQYYRFNSDLRNFATDGNGAAAVCANPTSCAFRASTAPWEPSIVYSVNGQPFSRKAISSMKGGELMEVEGYNFALSDFLECRWGAAEQAEAYEISATFPRGTQACNDGVPVGPIVTPAPTLPPPANPGGRRLLQQDYDDDVDGFVTQELLGRPDNYEFVVSGSDVYSIDTLHETPLTRLPTASTSTVQCMSPVAERLEVTQFSVINGRTLTPVDFEISEVGAECDGIDDYITMNAVVSSMSGTSYAYGLWVYPYSEPRPHPDLVVEASNPVYDDDAPVLPPGGSRRRLSSVDDFVGVRVPSDKRHSPIRRSLMGEAPPNSVYPHAPETTVLAFETLTGDVAERDKSLLMYDGVRFFYYDSRIQDAYSAGNGSQPGQWHYVYVQVDEEGNGELHVDCQLTQTFTTTSRPDPTGALTMCADVDAAGLLSSNFAGVIDELVIFNSSFASTSVDYEEQTCRRAADTSASGKFDKDRFENFNAVGVLAAYFDFTKYDKKECFATPEPTPEPTTPPPTAAPTLPPGGRRLLQEDGPSRRYNIDYTTLECGDIIMPDESGYDRHGRVSSLSTAPLPLRESAPWEGATTLSVDLHRSNIIGGKSVSVTGANLAPSTFLTVLLGGDIGVQSRVKGDPVRPTSFPPEDTLTVLDGLTFVAPAAECSVSQYTVAVTNAGRDAPLDTQAGVQLPYRVDMTDLVTNLTFANPFTAAFPGRNLERTSAAMLFSQSADPSTSPTRPSDLDAWTTCLWLRLAFPSDPFTMPGNRHVGGWKFACLDSEGEVWLNGGRPQLAEDVTFWGDLLGAYASTGTLFPNFTGYFHLPADEGGTWNVSALNRHLVDSAWLWPRVMLPCELLARYYTSEAYGLDFAAGDAEVRINATLALHDFHVDMWLYPYSAVMQQMLVTTTDRRWGIGLDGSSVMLYLYRGPCDCTRRRNGTGADCTEWFQMASHRAQVRPGRWSFLSVAFVVADDGAADLRLVVDSVLMDSYSWPAPGLGTVVEEGMMELMVGGEVGHPELRFDGIIAQLGMGKFDHWSTTAPMGSGSALETLYRDLPFSSKLNMECPGGGPSVAQRNVAHISLFGDRLPSLLDDPSVARLLSNISYDSPTDWSDTTFFGLPRSGDTVDTGAILSNHLAPFVLTMRNKCRQKRPTGGARLSATVSLPDVPDITFDLTINDTSDGNYHALIDAAAVVATFGRCSSSYRVNIEWDTDGSAITASSFTSQTLEIRPAATSTVTTSIFDPSTGPADQLIYGNGCFGVVNRWRIQAKDAQGCDKLPLQAGETGEVFEVVLSGPAEVRANVSYVDNSQGEYDVFWLAPSAGTYHLTAFLVGADGSRAEITGSGVCVEVCAGGSLTFTGEDDAEGWLEVANLRTGATGISPLELADPQGFTLETWFRISGVARSETPTDSPNSDTPYLLLKQRRNSNANTNGAYFAKGYSLGFDPAYENITATVYCGLGRYRAVTADLTTYQADTWIHVAAVYNASAYIIYLNGEPAATETWPEEALPAHPNEYNHPLIIGIGFRGAIDEVTLWSVPRTHAQVAATMFCPPLGDLEDVAGYWSFNSPTRESFGNYLGAGALCQPMAPDAVDVDDTYKPTCLIATIPIPDSSFLFEPAVTDDSPLVLSAYGGGMGAPSPHLSTITGPGLTGAAAYDATTTRLIIHARDKCGFLYNRGFPFPPDSTNPTLEDDSGPRVTSMLTSATQTVRSIYLSPDPPLATLPHGYPILDEGQRLQPLFATSLPGPCSADADYNETEHGTTGDVFELGIYAERTGNSYLEVAIFEEPVTSHRELMDEVSIEAPLTDDAFAPYVIPLTSGPPMRLLAEAASLRPVVAGVPAGVRVTLADEGGNPVEAPQPVTASLRTRGGAGGNVVFPQSVTYLSPGTYHLSLTAPSPGDYTLEVSLEVGADVAPLSDAFDLTADSSDPRPLVTSSFSVPAPSRRFEHTSVIKDDMLYVWGGASSTSGAHLNDMWALPLGPSDTTRGALAWRKIVTITPMVPRAGSHTVRVVVDTAELHTAGRMLDTCADVAFVLPPSEEGEQATVLSYHLDKFAGCPSTESVFWVRLPDGALADGAAVALHMYYGNPHPGQVAGYEDSAGALFFYEGFEGGVLGGINGTAFNASSPCRKEDAESSFAVTSELSYSGTNSLKATFGLKGATEALMTRALDSFTLRAAFYDNDAIYSSHFISPDYDICRPTPAGKVLIPEVPSTATGTYTMAHATQLCVSTPWTSVPVTRSAAWHVIDITSDPASGLTVSIDGQVVKAAEMGATLDRVFLSAGYGVDDLEVQGEDSLPEAMAMWDEIMVAENVFGLESFAGAMSGDAPVAWSPAREWSEVELAEGSPVPPPRQGHCSFLWGDELYIFAGERAGYVFDDMWKFSFSDSRWELLTDVVTPPGRYDAACFLMPDSDMLVVNGGKAGRAILSDTWAFELTTGEWVRMDTSGDALPARFGHTAAVSGEDVFFFGGFTDDAVFSNVLTRCFSLADMSAACEELPLPTVDGTTMPARFAHVSFADADYVYIHGGSSFEPEAVSGYGDVWRYVIDSGTWDRVNSAALPATQHTAHMAAPLHLAGDARHAGFIAHGGTDRDDGDVYFMPL